MSSLTFTCRSYHIFDQMRNGSADQRHPLNTRRLCSGCPLQPLVGPRFADQLAMTIREAVESTRSVGSTFEFSGAERRPLEWIVIRLGRHQCSTPLLVSWAARKRMRMMEPGPSKFSSSKVTASGHLIGSFRRFSSAATTFCAMSGRSFAAGPRSNLKSSKSE